MSWIRDRMAALLRWGLAASLSLVVLTALSAPARADGHGHDNGNNGNNGNHNGNNGNHDSWCPSGGGGGGGGGSVPEIDPNSMASALTLLVGGTLALAGRYRRR